MQRILVIQTAFIGDVILATPLAENIKAAHPQTHLVYLVRKGNENLLAEHPFIDEVWTLDKKANRLREFIRLRKLMRNYRPQLTINLQRFFRSGLLTLLSGAQKRVGFKKNPLSWFFTHRLIHTIGDGQHEVDRNLSVLQALSIPLVQRRPLLVASQSDKNKVDPYRLKPYFCFAPASVWYTKALPIEKWIELLQTLPHDHTVYLLGAPDDFELCENIRNSFKERTVNLCGQLSLIQSGYLMKGARMNYVNDSGPLHLCSAFNAPVNAFFCSTVPEFGFGPLSENSRVVQTPLELTCKPCGLHGYKACPRGHFDCGHTLDVRTTTID